jgi:hypothetical protein
MAVNRSPPDHGKDGTSRCDRPEPACMPLLRRPATRSTPSTLREITSYGHQHQPARMGLHLATRDWHVFPIAPGANKPPVIDRWGIRASTDPQQINRWWQHIPSEGTSGAQLRRTDFDVGHKGLG